MPVILFLLVLSVVIVDTRLIDLDRILPLESCCLNKCVLEVFVPGWDTSMITVSPSLNTLYSVALVLYVQ